MLNFLERNCAALQILMNILLFLRDATFPTIAKHNKSIIRKETNNGGYSNVSGRFKAKN